MEHPLCAPHQVHMMVNTWEIEALDVRNSTTQVNKENKLWAHWTVMNCSRYPSARNAEGAPRWQGLVGEEQYWEGSKKSPNYSVSWLRRKDSQRPELGTGRVCLQTWRERTDQNLGQSLEEAVLTSKVWTSLATHATQRLQTNNAHSTPSHSDALLTHVLFSKLGIFM